jgi:hypothetical protein
LLTSGKHFWSPYVVYVNSAFLTLDVELARLASSTQLSFHPLCPLVTLFAMPVFHPFRVAISRDINAFSELLACPYERLGGVAVHLNIFDLISVANGPITEEPC